MDESETTISSGAICVDLQNKVSDSVTVKVYDCHTAKEKDPGFAPSEECAEKSIINKALLDWNLRVEPVAQGYYLNTFEFWRVNYNWRGLYGQGYANSYDLDSNHVLAIKT